MKTKLTATAAILCLFIIFTAGIADDNGRAGYVGSPGETTCNTSNCHNSFTLNSGGGTISATSTMNNWRYDPFTTYSISVTVAKTGSSLFGFGTEILTATNTNAGTLSITDPAKTQLKTRVVSGVSRVNVVHQLNAGTFPDSATFTFAWTSPDTTAGNLTMYFAGNAANFNGMPSGDYIYNGTRILSPATTTGIKGFTFVDKVKIGPNPVADFIDLHFSLPVSERVAIRLVDLNGRSLLLHDSGLPAGENNLTLPISPALGDGIYFLAVESPSGRLSKKIVLQ